MYRFQNVVLRCPTPRLHCFLSSYWPSFRFLSFMAFLIHFIQLFFSLPRALFCFGIHFNAVLRNLPFAIIWTCPYHASWFMMCNLQKQNYWNSSNAIVSVLYDVTSRPSNTSHWQYVPSPYLYCTLSSHAQFMSCWLGSRYGSHLRILYISL